ncbi:MAG: bifunctional diguanylate cyclase/phosphohydrolase [Solirubrobacteraceae bacterium]
MKSWVASLERRLLPEGDVEADGHALLSAPGVRARLLGLLYLAGGSLALLSMVLPQPRGENEGVIYGVIAVGLLTGAILSFFAGRLPNRSFAAGLALATALCTVGIYATGQSTSVYAMFYVWLALAAAYFLPARGAATHVAFVAVAYGSVLLLRDTPDPIERWLITLGTAAVAGLFVGLLRRRVQLLVTRLSRAVDDLGVAARTDPLTGLLNRRGFQSMFEAELERSRRSGAPLALLVGDLDFFKRLNDSFGHLVGDRALEKLSGILTQHSRRIDTLARIGGEEFALLLPCSDAHGAFMFAERVRTAVQESFAQEALLLTISFGIATFPESARNAELVLGAADEALYAAKRMGRNRSVIHNPELRSLSTAAEDASGGIEVATVVTLAEALDLRDARTAQHSQTVGRYAELMARRLGLDEEHVERVRLAGIVHDVGKIAVPDAILLKPGALSAEEWAELRKHPETGARLLGGAQLDDVRAWVLAHHERPDGRGYPLGLGDDDIPLEAKILAVADASEAMTSDRVYRQALGPSAARDELLTGASTQFDPAVVEALLAALEAPGALVV